MLSFCGFGKGEAVSFTSVGGEVRGVEGVDGDVTRCRCGEDSYCSNGQ